MCILITADLRCHFSLERTQRVIPKSAPKSTSQVAFLVQPVKYLVKNLLYDRWDARCPRMEK